MGKSFVPPLPPKDANLSLVSSLLSFFLSIYEPIYVRLGV